MIKRITTYFLFLVIPFISFSQWSKLGDDITGMEGDKIGTNNSISLNASGQTIAIGSPFNSDNGSFSGYAKVFDFDGTGWVLRGDSFAGTLPDTEGTGAAVSLSADGLTIAVGSSHGINAQGIRCGVVNIYDWDGSSWILRGAQIDGEGNGGVDVFGSALNLSADGNFIVIGGRGNTPEPGVLEVTGHVRIYQWDGNQWVQVGQDIDGIRPLEEFGYSVSINDGGNVVAVGARSHIIIAPDSSSITQGAGYVSIFEWDGTDWKQRGDSFFGSEVSEKMGSAVSLSADGNTVGMGAPHSGSQTLPGYAKVFDWDGTSWVQRGEDILGENLAQAGSSLDLSADGNIIVVGEPFHNSAYGQVRVFKWNSSSWEQIDNQINESGPAGSINAFGSSVSISSDGSTVGVGAFGFDTGSFTDEGQVNIFRNQTLVNIEDLDISEITYYPNPTAHNLFIKSSHEIENLEIFTITGKRVNSIIVTDNEFDLDVSNLPSGTYFVKIRSLGKIQTIKMVKI